MCWLKKVKPDVLLRLTRSRHLQVNIYDGNNINSMSIVLCFNNKHPNRTISSPFCSTMAIPTMLSNLTSFENCKTSIDLSNSAKVYVQIICTIHGEALHWWGSKNKLRHQFATATLLSIHVLCSSPVYYYCRLPKKMQFVFFNRAIFSRFTCPEIVVLFTTSFFCVDQKKIEPIEKNQ